MSRIVRSVGQPAAGAGFTYALPESVRGTLIAVTFRIVTSAVVASRGPLVSVLDGSSTAVMAVAAGFAVTASSTVDYSFVAGLSEWDTSGTANASGPIAPFPLDDGDSIVLTVANIDAGDQVSRIRIVIDQRNVRE